MKENICLRQFRENWKYTVTDDISYNYLNAHEWGNNYFQCSGNRQSPINIDLSKIYLNNQNFNLTFHGYDVIPKEMKLSNTGQKGIEKGKLYKVKRVY